MLQQTNILNNIVRAIPMSIDYNKILGVAFSVFIFGFIIFIHELGHFIAAKKSGVKVNEFAIGMGPAIFKIQRKETTYALRLFPIGGFVAMDGEYDEGEDNQHSLPNASIPKRALIMSAGVIMNFLFGVILVVGLTFYQSAQPGVRFYTTTISETTNELLKAGDEIVEVNGKKVNNYTDLNFAMSRDDDGLIDFLVMRDGQKVEVKNAEFESVEVQEGLSVYDLNFTTTTEEPTFLNKLYQSSVRVKDLSRQVWVTLYDLITGKVSIKYVSGPVGITKIITEFSSSGQWQSTILLLALISINLAILNLLPLPVLDGGQIVLLIIEFFRGKPIKENTQYYITLVCALLLFGFMIFVTLNDVVNLFK